MSTIIINGEFLLGVVIGVVLGVIIVCLLELKKRLDA